MYLSVIIPAYNEEKRITSTLRSISDYLSRQPYSYEILVVSSRSSDNTVSVVRALRQSIPYLDILDLKKNIGKGYAVRQGMLESAGRIRLFMDADNATDISHFEKMRTFFDEGYEIVICSRDSKDAKGALQAVRQPFHKRLLGNLGNLFIQLVAVRGIWDTQCGFKAFRNFAADEIFGQLRTNGFGFDIEVLAMARLFGYRIGIVPAHWINDPHTTVSLSSYIKVLFETIGIAWNIRLGKYKKSRDHNS
ncbi:MAG: glycosyltransferase family 2 protein [Candidatus Niyogibacteria bacterium]|nr:glycosyltransferase family 2 protein [Candidatus Niyogibacteria bacterium]